MTWSQSAAQAGLPKHARGELAEVICLIAGQRQCGRKCMVGHYDQVKHDIDSTNLNGKDTVNLEIFAGILFTRIALKEIFAT